MTKELPPAGGERSLVSSDYVEIVDGQVTNRKPVHLTIETDGIVLPVNGTFQFVTAEGYYRAQFARKKALVMQSIETVIADAHHDHKDFWYATIHAINGATRAACAEHGLALTVCRDGELARVPLDGQKQDLWKQEFIFQLTDAETGYYEETRIPGLCEDKTGSGAFTKALRAAQKDFLVSTFMISVDSSPPTRGADDLQELVKSMEKLKRFLAENDGREGVVARCKDAKGIVKDKWGLTLQPFAIDYIDLVLLRDQIAEAVLLVEAENISDLKKWAKRLMPKVKEWFSS